jgi:ABC-type multidrug transport system ATPase subunit
MSSIIKVNNLSKQFNSIHAVNNLSFTVEEGDVYGFLGQNGAGKSTSIRMLLTLIKPTAGHISIFGKDLSNHRHEILKQVGAVIEKPDLYKYLSAYDNLAIFAKLSGMKPNKAVLMEQLKMVGLDDRADSKVKTFSQGMKQRLGIAVALVHNPRLIILDEPTNGLDPQGIADMRNLVLHLSRDLGKTIVVSSHLLSEIELVANRMLIIHKGKKIVEGNVAELLDPSKSLVEIETENDAETREKLLQTKWRSAVQNNANALQLKMNKEDVPMLIAEMVLLQVQVLSINPMHSLEDYFLSLTTQAGHVESIAD